MMLIFDENLKKKNKSISIKIILNNTAPAENPNSPSNESNVGKKKQKQTRYFKRTKCGEAFSIIEFLQTISYNFLKKFH